jgi:hypothetical protein
MFGRANYIFFYLQSTKANTFSYLLLFLFLEIFLVFIVFFVIFLVLFFN